MSKKCKERERESEREREREREGEGSDAQGGAKALLHSPNERKKERKGGGEYLNRSVSCRCGAFSYGILPNKGDGVIPGRQPCALLNAGERERESESQSKWSVHGISDRPRTLATL